MKFEDFDCWKHSNCLDAFFFINSVVQDDNGKAILLGHWMVQGIDSYWMASNQDRIFIKGDQYDNWFRYEPKGSFYGTESRR